MLLLYLSFIIANRLYADAVVDNWENKTFLSFENTVFICLAMSIFLPFSLCILFLLIIVFYTVNFLTLVTFEWHQKEQYRFWLDFHVIVLFMLGGLFRTQCWDWPTMIKFSMNWYLFFFFFFFFNHFTKQSDNGIKMLGINTDQALIPPLTSVTCTDIFSWISFLLKRKHLMRIWIQLIINICRS